MTTAERVPVAEGLFAETPAGPRLLGSRCATCDTPYFPKVTVCRAPTCNASKIEANLQDGVLKLTIPRRDEARPRRIAVNVA